MDDTYWHGLHLTLWHQLMSILFLMVVLVPAAIGDYQKQKIPNWLSMSGWIIGPIMGGVFAGVVGLTDSLLGLTFMLAIMFPLWMIHWFGAADAKLLGSIGAVVGFRWAPEVLLGVVLVGMALSLVVLAYRRQLPLLLHGSFLTQMFKPNKQGEATQNMASTERGTIPYAIPIAFGTMLTILYLQMH